MIRGIYTSASGMLVDQRRMEVVANNLANASTTGFKRDTTVAQSFRDLIVERMYDRDVPGAFRTETVGQVGVGVFLSHSATRLTTGALRPTGNPLDVAISGDGFFAVATPQGIRYTRQGAFTQNQDGTLVTQDGHAVLVDGNPVQAEAGAISIAQSGEVLVNGNAVGRLSVIPSAALGALRREGANLWVEAGADEISQLISPMEANGQYELKVGYLESSNVETVNEMVEMMTIMRSYEANQRAIQAQDETLQRAANDVGRVG